MTHPVKGIDHCFALVDDLDLAAAQYQALGFTLSPRGVHSTAKGTANYTIMFPDDYFELLGIVTATTLNAARRETLGTLGQGLHAIACRIDDAEQAATSLSELGIQTHGLGSFSRPLPLPDGSEGIAAFSTVAFTPENTPRGMVFMCQHKTRETVWLPELLDHPNTACGLGAILALSDTPAQDAERFAKLWAAGKVTSAEGCYTVHTGPNSAPLILLDLPQMEVLYPGIDLSGTAKGAFTALRVKVRDLSTARDCLTHTNVSFCETKSGLVIGPAFSSGVVMEFVSA